MRIAIVGSGIAGLTCAHRLHAEHEITLFEAADHLGGHSHTVDLHLDDGDYAVDTGFIVYNERNYPEFSRLLGELGVATQPSDMSFSVSHLRSGFEYCPSTLNGLFAQRSNLARPSFHRLWSEILRFNKVARSLVDAPERTETLAELLVAGGFAGRVVTEYIVPMGAAIWSSDPMSFPRYPAASYARFMHNHGLLSLGGRPQWRTISGGSKRYVEALTAPFSSSIRRNAPVVSIRRPERDRVEVTVAGCEPEPFDHVIVATHSDEALRLLDDPTDAEIEVLSAISYQPNRATLHTDATVMPRRRRAWASWNYHLTDVASGRACLTYHMNRLQHLSSRHEILVTLNDEGRIDPASIVTEIDYAHPVFTTAAFAAQRRHHEVSGQNATSYCGAYWGYGFHEDGVESALAVCAGLSRRRRSLV